MIPVVVRHRAEADVDVLLLDRNEHPVVVECKQHAPTVADLDQIRHYMQLLKVETGREPRGILVHGGAAKLHAGIFVASAAKPPVEIVQYDLDVAFTTCR